MQTINRSWTSNKGWSNSFPQEYLDRAQLVFVFGSRKSILEQNIFSYLRQSFPKAVLVGCSTSGEILNDGQVLDDSLVITAAIFDYSRLECSSLLSSDYANSYDLGKDLVQKIPADDLAHVFVLSDGVTVNGSQLVDAITESLPEGVGLTGGLAGDGTDFSETLVCSNDEFGKGKVAILGFYGNRLKVGYGSLGGFVPFGPERRVTKS